MSDTEQKSVQKPELHLKFVAFEGIEGIESRPYFNDETQAWLDKWNAYAKREAARRWAKKHPSPLGRKLRRALGARIRGGKERGSIRAQRLKHALTRPSVLAELRRMILDRASQPALFPMLLDALAIREEGEPDASS